MPVNFAEMNPVYNIHCHRTRHQISYERKLGNLASLTAKSPFVNLILYPQYQIVHYFLHSLDPFCPIRIASAE